MLAKKTLFIALFVVITSSFTWSDWEDRKGPPPTVYLSQLLENPESWLDIPVKIPLRFSDIRQIYTPFFTRFDRDNFLNFSAWDIHTPIWEKEGFSNDYPFFYVAKDAKEFKAFLRLEKFDTIAVMGKVSSIFKGKPYFQIVWVCKQEGDLNIENLRLLNKGSKAFQEGRFDESMEHFVTMYHTGPPEDIKALVHKNMAQIYLYEKKDYKLALAQIRQGLKRAKNDAHLLMMRDQCENFMKNGGAEPQPIILSKEQNTNEQANSENYANTTNTSSGFTEIVDDNNYEWNDNSSSSFVDTTSENTNTTEDFSSIEDAFGEDDFAEDVSADSSNGADSSSEDEFDDFGEGEEEFLDDEDFDDRN